MMLKRILSIAISSMIALPPQVFASPQGGPGDRIPDNVDPKVESFLKDLENGRIQDHPAKDADMFHVTDQEIDIFEKGRTTHFNLNERQAEIPYVAFTGLKVIYDSKNKALYFDAYRGLDKNGENGVLVARQTLRNVDVLASAQDAELFQFVDSKMTLHVIDMGLVALQVFKAPIPIFQNLWRPDAAALEAWVGSARNLEWKGGVKAGFLTRGSKPMNLSRSVLTPHDGEGKIRLSAGDFYIASKSAEGEEAYAYAVFARETTYNQIVRGYKILQWQAALLSPKPEIQAQVESIVDELTKEIDKQELELINEKVSPAARAVISSLNDANVETLGARQTGVQGLKGHAFDKFSKEEWTKTYADISKNVDPETPDKAKEQLWFKMINKIQGESSLQKSGVLSRLKIHDRMISLRKKLAVDPVYQNIAIAVTVSTPYMFQFLAPYVNQYWEVIQQLKVVAWAYNTLYPDVLKDAVYRTPLLLSMASLAAIWPEAVLFSATVGKTLKSMAEKVKNETTRKAIYIKDLAHNWSGLNNWQRITSFGMRGYAWLVLPYWRVLIQYLAQQKTFFSAVNNDLSPLEKVLADSEMGEKLGLTKDQRIGLNQILGQGKTERIEKNREAQSALAQENQKLDSIALLVAATLVAEKHKLDPATLMLLSKQAEGLEINRISEILETHEMRQEWQMLSDVLIGQMASVKKEGLLVDNHMSELIARYYEKGEEVAKKIDAMSPLRKKLLRFRMAFSSRMSNKIKAFSNFAVQDHEFLKRVYTDDFVSGQVQKEFTIDHIMVVGIVGLVGERADLSHPEYLSANANNFMWTSKAHWFDMFQNTYAHFFAAGSQTALVYQKVRPQVAANYAPIEDYEYVSAERTQGLASGAKDWLKVVNLAQSDMGGIIMKRFTKRFTTITAGITMLLVMRIGMLGYPIVSSLKAWVFSFYTAQWFYGWIWDPVQQGNSMEADRIDKMNEDLKSARREISRGDFEKGRADLKNLYARYNPKVLKVFGDFDDMSKTELLLLSTNEPPVYTSANRWTSWFSTWVAAAGSTVMAVPLSVIVMDEKLINDPAVWYKWFAISTVAYAAAYGLQAKYLAKYKDFFASVKAKWNAMSGTDMAAAAEKGKALAAEAEAAAKARAEARAAADPSAFAQAWIRFTGRSCEALFAPAR